MSRARGIELDPLSMRGGPEQRLAARVSALEQQLERQAMQGNNTFLNQEDWRAFGFLTGWRNNVGNVPPYAPGACLKDPSGFVHLRGCVELTTSLAANTYSTIAVLPVGYRPSYRYVQIVSLSQPGVNTIGLGQCVVFETGEIKVASAYGPAPIDYTILDPILFRSGEVASD